MNRRCLFSAMLATALPLPAAERTDAGRLGLVLASYTHRWRGKYSSFKIPPFKDALDVMDHIRGLGFGSLQMPVNDWTLDLARQIRRTCESYGMGIEGSIRLPMTEADAGRFERELRTAREAGVTVLRSALGGRRYELFTRRADFEAWKTGALKAMALAEPVARKVQVKIGIENHKDWELSELLDALKGLSSESIGACVDTGNSLALLEDPLAVVEALAPYAVTVHLKDVAVRAYEDGFRMSEVPLGTGSLDLPKMIQILRKAVPGIQMHLEMITREPLDIPCLRETYWASFPDKPGLDLARTLAWVQAHEAEKLPDLRGLSKLALLNLEEENILACQSRATELMR
ncbi:sugar phosphate isomerase/epimerase family protein [Prosthecobacter sp. SYSU 5D2]|uniref:sugar phosphate isomerase/epimerase family protein n=1 Tax=Prosthecobacter sp. SYSU 5D2 TaxID=3134134 RepID=UPI0031FEF253